MIQQYELLRKENDPLKSLIGQSFNQKNKFEAEKILDEIHSKAESRLIGKTALCYVHDQGEIKGVGGSTLMKDKNGKIVSNLILDQLGVWLAGIFKSGITANKTVVMQTSGDVAENVNTYGATVFNNSGTNFGAYIEIGSGSTAPARDDFSIETAFGTSPEDFRFDTSSDPVWNSGLGNFKALGSIVAGASGTINESSLLFLWDNNASTLRQFNVFRDAISPGQAFTAGQSIAVEYTVQL